MFIRIKFWKLCKQSRGCLVLNYPLLSTHYKLCWLTRKSGFHNFNGSKLPPEINIRNHSIKPILVVRLNCIRNEYPQTPISKFTNTEVCPTSHLKLTPNWTCFHLLGIIIKHLICCHQHGWQQREGNLMYTLQVLITAYHIKSGKPISFLWWHSYTQNNLKESNSIS